MRTIHDNRGKHELLAGMVLVIIAACFVLIIAAPLLNAARYLGWL